MLHAQRGPRWYYFFTPDYGFWDKHLREALAGSFDLQPIRIDELQINQRAAHHFQGISRKIELIVECVQENLGNRILFTDCTQWIVPGRAPELAVYLNSAPLQEFEMVMADNAIDDSVNIGLIAMDCSERVLRFWQRCIDRMDAASWDQAVVNKLLGGQTWKRRLGLGGLRWGLFDPARIVCGYEFNESYRSTCYVYKQFIIPSNPTSNWNQRIRELNRFGFIDDETLRDQERQESS